MDKEKLIKLGLNKSETDIYISLLRAGKATTTQLSKDTGIHRTYIYDLLEKLREKALVSQIKEKGKLYFQAANPEKIKDNLLNMVKIADDLIPELKEIQSRTEEDTTVEVYKGKEGVKTILNDMVKEAKNYYAVGAMTEFEALLPEWDVEQFILNVNKLKLKEKVILGEGEKITEAKRKEYKYLPKEYPFLSSFIIYGNKVALFVWKEPYLQILIKNKDIARTYLTQFNALWKIAKK